MEQKSLAGLGILLDDNSRSHTHTHTPGGTPQDEGLDRLRDLYLTTHNTDIHASEFTGLAQIITLIRHAIKLPL
jgi:hypothetical protein